MNIDVKKKLWQGLALAAAGALVLSGCTGSRGARSGASEDGKSLVVAGTLPGTTAMIQGAERFSEAIKKESDGALVGEVFADGQLGGEPEMLEALKLGTVDIAMVGAPLIATYCPKLGVTSLPYVIQGDSPEEQYENLLRIAESGANTAGIEECAAEEGYRVLDDSWWYGNRHVTSNTAIETPEDIKRLRIRTPEGSLHSQPFNVLGAEAVPMAQSEVYTALETGVIDGQENPFATTFKHAFYETQKYMNLTGLLTHNQVIVMSEKTFSSLSEDEQKILTDAVKEAGKWQSQEQMKENDQLRAELESKGMEIVESDTAQFAAALDGFVQDYFDEVGLNRDDFISVQD